MTPGTETVKEELLELERRYWQAMKDRDVDAALRLTDDQCIVAGAQGVAAVDHETFAQMMDSDEWTLHDFRIDGDVAVRRISDDVVVLGYRVHEDMTVEGKPLSFDAADTSVWVRRGGRWLCALHTESLSGDPFGRDKVTSP